MSETKNITYSNLGDVVMDVRLELNYYVYRGVGITGKILRFGLKLMRKTAISDFHEYRILSAAAEFYGKYVSIDDISSGYRNVNVPQNFAKEVGESFKQGVGEYIQLVRRQYPSPVLSAISAMRSRTPS